MPDKGEIDFKDVHLYPGTIMKAHPLKRVHLYPGSRSGNSFIIGVFRSFVIHSFFTRSQLGRAHRSPRWTYRFDPCFNHQSPLEINHFQGTLFLDVLCHILWPSSDSHLHASAPYPIAASNLSSVRAVARVKSEVT